MLRRAKSGGSLVEAILSLAVNRTDQLNTLFDEWQRSQSSYADDFSRDGIVDEYAYDRAAFRYLFVLKEPNNHNKDIRDHARWAASHAGHEIRGFVTWRNLARWSYGLLQNVRDYDSLKDTWQSDLLPQCAWDSLLQVAVVNLKKTRGLAASRFKTLAAFARDPINQRFFREELNHPA